MIFITLCSSNSCIQTLVSRQHIKVSQGSSFWVWIMSTSSSSVIFTTWWWRNMNSIKVANVCTCEKVWFLWLDWLDVIRCNIYFWRIEFTGLPCKGTVRREEHRYSNSLLVLKQEDHVKPTFYLFIFCLAKICNCLSRDISQHINQKVCFRFGG